MDDLIQTLDRMQIKPIGRESANRSFSEHGVIPPVADTSEEAAATHAGGAISVAALRADLDTSMNGAEPKCRVDPNDGCASGESVTKSFIARRLTRGRSPVR